MQMPRRYNGYLYIRNSEERVEDTAIQNNRQPNETIDPHLVNGAKTPLEGSIRAREGKREGNARVTTQKDVGRGRIRETPRGGRHL